MEGNRKKAVIYFAGRYDFDNDNGDAGFAVHTYYWPDAISADAMDIKNWTWKAEGEAAALAPSVGLIPTGLSQQETALMGGYTSKFWFQDEKAKTITIPGTSAELDFQNFITVTLPAQTVITPVSLHL